MISTRTTDIAERAKVIYGRRLRTELEAAYLNSYVAIEPDSGDHFLGDSFGQAVAAARRVHPDRIAFVIRIGHPTAIDLGGLVT